MKISNPKVILQLATDALKARAVENPQVSASALALANEAQEHGKVLIARVDAWQSEEARKMRILTQAIGLLHQFMPEKWDPVDAFSAIVKKKKLGRPKRFLYLGALFRLLFEERAGAGSSLKRSL